MSFFCRRNKSKSGWKLKTAGLAERPEDVRNPGRGWYRIYTFPVDLEPDFEELMCSLDKRDTLALLFLDIGGYRDSALDETALDRMRRLVEFFRDHGYDMILRVAYDHQGKAVEREAYFWDQVKEHMRQIGEFVKDCGACIFVYQGLLIGNWGEMHTTRFQDGKKRKELWEILREYRPEGTYAAVRRPSYWRQLHEGQINGESGEADMGLFDDAMFASEDHLGTFGVLGRENGWGEAWNREEELRFEKDLCQSVPNGGEAVYGEDFQKQLTPELVLDILRKMHITYLNKAYDAKILDIWKQWKFAGAEEWNGKSLYEYIGAHLGYRLVIRSVRLSAGRGDSGRLEITVENTGFASLYRAADFWLYSGEEGRAGLLLEQEDKKLGAVWKSGERRVLSGNVTLKAQELWIGANRRADGKVIRFVNGCDGDGKTKLGELCLQCAKCR